MIANRLFNFTCPIPPQRTRSKPNFKKTSASANRLLSVDRFCLPGIAPPGPIIDMMDGIETVSLREFSFIGPIGHNWPEKALVFRCIHQTTNHRLEIPNGKTCQLEQSAEALVLTMSTIFAFSGKLSSLSSAAS